MAKLERITLDQAWELSVVQALNDLAYLKAKGQRDKEQIKQWHAK